MFLLQKYTKYGIIPTVMNMDEKILDSDIKRLYEELIDYEISMEDFANEHNFNGGEKTLTIAIKNYCKKNKLTIPSQIKHPEKYPSMEEEEMYELHTKKHFSVRMLSEIYHKSPYSIKKSLEKFKDDDTNNFNLTDSDIEQIIKELEDPDQKSYTSVARAHGITFYALKKVLEQNPKGIEILKKRKEQMEEQRKARNNEMLPEKSVEEKQVIQEVLQKSKEDGPTDEPEKILKLFLNGFSRQEISDITGISVKSINKQINSHYETRGKEVPRILSKEEFESHLAKQEKVNIDEVIKFFEAQHKYIPEPYIQEYYRKIGEVDLRHVKRIVNTQLAQLKNEGKDPNFVSPFQLANKLKEQGYRTKYQACALLYRVISENNLSSSIVQELENPELISAIQLLVDDKCPDKIEYLKRLKENELAYTIYLAQNQTSTDQYAKSFDD